MNLKEGCIEIYLKNLVLMNQGEFKRALMFTDSICGERQCDVLCNWARFTYYLNVGSFSECEHYSKQIEKDFTLMIYYKNWTKINWAYVNYRQNRPKKADEMFRELISDLERSLDNGNFWSLFDLSRIYSFKNDKKTSLKYLREYEKYGITFGLLDYIFIDPLFENLRDDPDFIEIVNRVLEEKAKSRDEIRNLLQEEPI